MGKRYLRAIVYLGIIVLIICLFVSGYYFISIPLLIAWYLFFGFIAIVHYFLLFGNIEKCNLFIITTMPYLLLKQEKAYYYLFKASIISSQEKDDAKALDFANKVKERDLSSDNDRSIFNSYVACLFSGLECYDEALKHINMAIEIKHKKVLDEKYDQLYQEIKQKLEILYKRG